MQYFHHSNINLYDNNNNNMLTSNRINDKKENHNLNDFIKKIKLSKSPFHLDNNTNSSNDSNHSNDKNNEQKHLKELSNKDKNSKNISLNKYINNTVHESIFESVKSSVSASILFNKLKTKRNLDLNLNLNRSKDISKYNYLPIVLPKKESTIYKNTFDKGINHDKNNNNILKWNIQSTSKYINGEKTFECCIINCSKKFTDRKLFKKHLLIHREKKFKCEYDNCDKKFFEKAKLKRHYLVHTGEKPFCCPFEICGKKFGYKANLKTHLRTHTGLRPFECTYKGCNKKFAQASNRNSHSLIHQKGPEDENLIESLNIKTPLSSLSSISSSSFVPTNNQNVVNSYRSQDPNEINNVIINKTNNIKKEKLEKENENEKNNKKSMNRSRPTPIETQENNSISTSNCTFQNIKVETDNNNNYYYSIDKNIFNPQSLDTDNDINSLMQMNYLRSPMTSNMLKSPISYSSSSQNNQIKHQQELNNFSYYNNNKRLKDNNIGILKDYGNYRSYPSYKAIFSPLPSNFISREFCNTNHYNPNNNQLNNLSFIPLTPSTRSILLNPLISPPVPNKYNQYNMNRFFVTSPKKKEKNRSAGLNNDMNTICSA